MGWTGTITNVGNAMLSQLIAGATMTLSHVKTSSGYIDTSTTGHEDDIAEATDVTTAVDTWQSITSSIESDGIRLRFRIYPHAGSSGYLMKQVGLFGRIGSGNAQLFALFQWEPDPNITGGPTGVEIPANDYFPDFVYNMGTFVVTDHADSIEIEVDGDSMAALSDVEEAVANLVTLERNFYASSSSISVPCSANSQKAFLVFCSTAAMGNNGGIMDATYGGLFIVSNGTYAVIHKGTGVQVSLSGGVFTAQSTSSVKMVSVEL